MSQAGQEVVFLCLISISFVIGRWSVTLPERTGSCIPLPATCGSPLGCGACWLASPRERPGSSFPVPQ